MAPKDASAAHAHDDLNYPPAKDCALFIYLFIYTYNDIHRMKVAINVEVTMTMKEDTIERR